MHQLGTDLRYGLRMLAKTPAATATVLIALSLGIGISTLTFSIVDSAVMPTLPVPDGDRVVRINRMGQTPTSAVDFERWSTRQRSFDGLAGADMRMVSMATPGFAPRSTLGAAITPSLLPLLQVEPALGRGFTDADASPGAPAVALINHALWMERFAGEASAIGEVVRVDGAPASIVGVMPEGFGFPLDQQVWTPLDLDPAHVDPAAAPAGDGRFIVGRLRREASHASAAAELTALTRELDTESRGAAGPESAIRVAEFTDMFGDPGGRTMVAVLLTGVALLVLLVACANVTNVLLARAIDRQREVAVRMAMGASRVRVTLQLLAEVSLVAAAGGVGGALLGLFGMRAIDAAMPPGMPYWISFRMSTTLLGFVAIVAVVAAIAAGLMPALLAGRVSTDTVLKESSRGSAGVGVTRVMGRLIAVEIGLSFALLVLAGLFIKSGMRFRATEFAFEPREVYTAMINIPAGPPGDSASRGRLAEELREGIAALPDVEAVALGTAVPGVGSSGTVSVDIRGSGDTGEEAGRRARSIAVTPEYFELFRAPPVAGRTFRASELTDASAVAVVNEAFAESHLGGSALDQRIRLVGTSGEEDWRVVVGVVPDLLPGGIEVELPETVYLPLDPARREGLVLVARPRVAFSNLVAPIRDAVLALDPDIALFNIQPLDQVIASANSHFRWLSIVFLVSGGVALFLAVTGLYGVMAFWVIQRTHEIGVRMALGGRRVTIAWLVLRRGMARTAIGLAVGLLLALPAALWLGSALFGVRPWDPVVFGLTGSVLALAAVLGCGVPVRRATRLDPRRVLAGE